MGDDVGDIAFHADSTFVLGDKVRVVIESLSRKNFKLIKSLGIVAEVQLAKHGRLVACLLKKLGKSNVGGIKGKVVVNFTVEVGVLAGENGGPAGCTDGIGHCGIRKEHAHLGDTVNIGSFDEAIAVGRNRLVGMVIRHDKDDVGTAWVRAGGRLSPGLTADQKKG